MCGCPRGSDGAVPKPVVGGCCRSQYVNTGQGISGTANLFSCCSEGTSKEKQALTGQFSQIMASMNFFGTEYTIFPLDSSPPWQFKIV
mmetsp:Transcript_27719/g.54590  ORF Transcript_27719/g.54590 Transcript_27719/m.54590 type:complete len:88 (-) Transcript_27719:32-295(-)